MRVIGLWYKDDSFRSLDWLPLTPATTAVSDGDTITFFNPAQSSVPILSSNSLISTPPNNWILSSGIISNSVSGYIIKAKSAAGTSMNVTFQDNFGDFKTYTLPLTTNFTLFENFALNQDLRNSGVVSLSNITFQGLSMSDSYTIDFIALKLAPANEADLPGTQYTFNINYKIGNLTIPNSSDIIQQLGYNNPQHDISLFSMSYSDTQWLTQITARNTPVCIILPSLVETGFLQSVNFHTEGGWFVYSGNITTIKGDTNTIV